MGLFFFFRIDSIFEGLLSETSEQIRKKHGSRKHLVLPAQEVRARLQELPRLLQPPRPHPKVQPEPLPAMLQGVRQRHRLQEARLGRDATIVDKKVCMRRFESQ